MKNRTKTFCSRLLIFCFAVTFPAAMELDIKNACEIALKNNADIRTQEINLESAKRLSNHSWNSASPSLSLSVFQNYPNAKNLNDKSLTLEAKALINFSTNLFFEIQKAKKDFELANINYEEMRRSIEKNVRTAYFALLYEKDNIEFLMANLDTLKNQYELNSEKYKLGNLSRLDVISSQLSYEKAKPQLEEAIVTNQNNQAAFLKVIGLETSENVTISDKLEDFMSAFGATLSNDEIQKYFQDAFNSTENPSVKIARKNLEIAKTGLYSGRMSAYSPIFSASYSYQHEKSTESSETTSKKGGSVSLGVTLPLDGFLPWSKTSDSIRDSKDSVKKCGIQLSEAEKSARIDFEAALGKLIQKKNSLSSLELGVKLAEQSYDMALEAYNRGSKDLLSLQNASDQKLEAKTLHSAGMLAYLTECTNLEAMLGLEFGSLFKREI